MTYADLEKARECHGALREIFIHHPGGWADKEALYRVEKLAWQAMTLVKDTECQEKLGIIEHYAAALYSEAEPTSGAWRRCPAPIFFACRSCARWSGSTAACSRSRPRATAPNPSQRRSGRTPPSTIPDSGDLT